MGNCCSNEEKREEFKIDTREVSNRKRKRKGAGPEMAPEKFMEEKSNIREYANEIVLKKEKELGDYVFDDSGDTSKTKVEWRPTQLVNNTTRYEGEWSKKENKRHGKGTQVWADGSMYVGTWRDGKAEGKGRLIHADGDAYEGEWKNDEADGRGIYYHADGARYEGEWKNDKQSGSGKESWPDGSLYIGKYINGK